MRQIVVPDTSLYGRVQRRCECEALTYCYHVDEWLKNPEVVRVRFCVEELAPGEVFVPDYCLDDQVYILIFHSLSIILPGQARRVKNNYNGKVVCYIVGRRDQCSTASLINEVDRRGTFTKTYIHRPSLVADNFSHFRAYG
jgi:hypothetical protein